MSGSPTPGLNSQEEYVHFSGFVVTADGNDRIKYRFKWHGGLTLFEFFEDKMVNGGGTQDVPNVIISMKWRDIFWFLCR